MKWIKWVVKKVKQGAKEFWTLPPGFAEYQRAILAKDRSFNFMENEYFLKVILPRTQLNFFNNISPIDVAHSIHSPIDNFRVNPASGLPMIGAYDAAGNSYGFDRNYHSHHSTTQSFTQNYHSMFDYWT